MIFFVLILSFLILYTRENPLFHFQIFELDIMNAYLNHQMVMVLLAIVTLGVIFILANETRLYYFRIHKIDGPIIPEKILGINPKPTESWKHLGRNFTIIITVVTAIIIYFQIINGKTIELNLFPILFFVVVFAITNSFAEEVMFRLSFVSIVMNEKLNPIVAKVLGAIIFGGIHFWGAPGGIVGVIVAAFLGWFLTKSIIETKGFFWAWFIHFCQDVVILFSIFTTNS